MLNADWYPRSESHLSEWEASNRWTDSGRSAWRNPELRLETVPEPDLDQADALRIAVGACGVCGSDVHLLETDGEGYTAFGYHLRCPVIAGHELAGEVVEVGPAVREFAVGDLVAVESLQWCGNCRACRGGYPNSCERPEDIGFTLDGGFGEYVVARERAVWSLNPLRERYPDTETVLELGALCEPISCVYEAMFSRAGGFRPGADVVVFGAGPIGLAAVALALGAGAAQVVAVEPAAERRGLAERLGATACLDPGAVDLGEALAELTEGRGAGMAIEASGNWPAVLPSLGAALGVGGKAVVIGIDSRVPQLDPRPLQLHAGSLYGSSSHAGSWNYPSVIQLMAHGRIQVQDAVTKRVGYGDVVTALRQMAAGAPEGKVLVKASIQ